MPVVTTTRSFPRPLAIVMQLDGRQRLAHGRLRRLGALTPDQAAQQAMPTSTIRSTAGFTQTVYNDIVQAAQNGNFISFNPSGCAGVTPSGAKLSALTTAGGAIAGKIALTIASGPAAPIVAGVAAALDVFGALFSHHAQAVAKEQQVVCAAVPAASDSLSAIEQAVANGTVDPASGTAMLQNLLQSFTSQVSSIIKENSSQCNAACVWVKQLTAIVAELSSQYQDLANAQAAAGTSTGTSAAAGSTAAAATDSSLLVPLAIAAGVAFLFLK